MPPDRLDGRDGEVWRAYVGGATQERIAAEHGITQQRVSQVLAEVRATIPDGTRVDAALLAAERTDALLAAVWPAAMGGDTRAVLAALKVLERNARAMGTDAQEPLRVTLERHLDDEGQLVADALGAALDALVLTEEQRIAALAAAQARLLGADPPAVVPSAPVGPSADDVRRARLEDDFRAFCEAEGVDPDEDDDDGEDGQEDGDGDR
jgi:hypothetical protein